MLDVFEQSIWWCGTAPDPEGWRTLLDGKHQWRALRLDGTPIMGSPMAAMFGSRFEFRGGNGEVLIGTSDSEAMKASIQYVVAVRHSAGPS